MAAVDTARLPDIPKLIESLTGVPQPISPNGMSAKERQEQEDRVRRFLALPAPLQEGVLRYGERIREAYKS